MGLPPTETLRLSGGVELELVLVPAGRFIMGTAKPTKPPEAEAVGQEIVGISGAGAGPRACPGRWHCWFVQQSGALQVLALPDKPAVAHGVS